MDQVVFITELNIGGLANNTGCKPTPQF